MNNRLGLQKLILFNSGGFRCAEFDLTRPVHLAAINNGGKTTLVNALQFLFVDDFEEMDFGDNDPASTRNHYFGKVPSYIVFECLTRTGPQCLLVSGSGDIANSKFSRFVYRGSFDRSQFDDGHGRLANITALHQNLLAHDVVEVKHNRLWRLISTPNDMKGDDEEASRLGILPLKRIEDYRSFRDVFIRLLKLSKATSEELKRLLIACSCQAIRATSINVSKQYADQFSQLEREDVELEWLQTVAAKIELGTSLRLQLAKLDHERAQSAILSRRQIALGNSTARRLEAVATGERHEISEACMHSRAHRDSINKSVAQLETHLEYSNQQLADIDACHAKWAAISDLEVAAWKGRQTELGRSIHLTQAQIDESVKHDIPSLEKQLQQKQQECAQRTRELNDWEKRTSAYLAALGFNPAEIISLFSLVNPILGKRSHRDVFGEASPESIRSLIRDALTRHTDGHFVLNGVTIQTAGACSAGDISSTDRDSVRKSLHFAQEEASRLNLLLETARNSELARQKVVRETDELDALGEKIRGYEGDRIAYANRAQLVEKSDAWKSQITQLRDDIIADDREYADLSAKLSALEGVGDAIKRWQSDRDILNNLLSDIEIGTIAEPSEYPATSNPADAVSLRGRLETLCDEIAGIRQGLVRLGQQRQIDATQLKAIQGQIAAEGRKRGTRTALFDQDENADWVQLELLRDALNENEQHLQTQWDAMFKSLAGELDLLRRSVSEVKKRASRINADLKRYKVSNLESVEIAVDHGTSEYAVVETMTSPDSMFLKDRDAPEAKRQLRLWIKDGKTIELRDLFAVRIRIRNHGETVPLDVASLDVIGSKGTGMTAKVMIYLQLLRSILEDPDSEYQMHFCLDELGSFDERNLRATTEMAVRRGFTPITAEPDPRAESLAHPEVLIYHIEKNGKDFEIVQNLTYRARAKRPSERVAT